MALSINAQVRLLSSLISDFQLIVLASELSDLSLTMFYVIVMSALEFTGHVHTDKQP